MLKFAFMSQVKSEHSEWSYKQYSPSFCDALILDGLQLSVLRYRR